MLSISMVYIYIYSDSSNSYIIYSTKYHEVNSDSVITFTHVWNIGIYIIEVWLTCALKLFNCYHVLQIVYSVWNISAIATAELLQKTQ